MRLSRGKNFPNHFQREAVGRLESLGNSKWVVGKQADQQSEREQYRRQRRKNARQATPPPQNPGIEIMSEKEDEDGKESAHERNKIFFIPGRETETSLGEVKTKTSPGKKRGNDDEQEKSNSYEHDCPDALRWAHRSERGEVAKKRQGEEKSAFGKCLKLLKYEKFKLSEEQ